MTDRLIDAPHQRAAAGRFRLGYPEQGHQHDHPTVPKGALWAAAAIMLATVLGAAAARYGDVGAVRVEAPAPAVSRLISFHQSDAGALEVRGDGSAAPLARFAPGEAGFVHGVLRAMRRDRAPQGVAETAPYALGLDAGGRLTLSDPSTGREIELRGFGADHYATFRGLLGGG